MKNGKIEPVFGFMETVLDRMIVIDKDHRMFMREFKESTKTFEWYEIDLTYES